MAGGGTRLRCTAAAAAVALQHTRCPTAPWPAAWFIAGIFVILAVSASIYEVRCPGGRSAVTGRSQVRLLLLGAFSSLDAWLAQVAMHLEYYNRPKLQLRVVRILWMVPIYAVDSWMSLRFKEARCV